MFNIFQHLRNYNVDITNENLIDFEVKDTLEAQDYCSKSIAGKYPYYAVDGNQNTAWTNKEQFNADAQYFIIDFIERKVALKSYTIETLCNPPLQLYLEGSNNKIQWILLSHITKPLKNYSLNTYFVNNYHSFRYLRFSQSKSEFDYRFIIRNIELFGTFGKLERKTCYNMIPLFKSNLFIYIMNLLK